MTEVGAPKQGLMNIGEEAKPPFAILPDPSTLFQTRSRRLAVLAAGHELEPYLKFLSRLTQAQHDAIADRPHDLMPSPEAIAQSLAYGMPPLLGAKTSAPASAQSAILHLLGKLGIDGLPAATLDAIELLRAAPPAQLEAIAAGMLNDSEPQADIAPRVLVAAGLQVLFAQLAAKLVADDLVPVADAACPACGSAPIASAVVGLAKANNTRFCTCSLCGTQWNVVRVKCVLCSATGGISYHLVEGKPDTVKAETCDACHAYVKILYQVQDPALEVLCDDIATLGLDMLMAEDGWKRGGRNPFLMGY
jgi:FdhE protein